MHWRTKLLLTFLILTALILGAVLYVELTWAHTGTLDAYGCHSNKALYGTTAKRECHKDLLAGQVFASTTAEYKAYIEAQRAVISQAAADLAACKKTCQEVPLPPIAVVAHDSASIGLGEKQAPIPKRELTLTWDPNTEPDLATYKAYCGIATKTYTIIQVIPVPTTTATFSNLLPATYYCAVTARDLKGNESGFSNEVTKVIQ